MSLTVLLVYLLIAAVVGLIAERIVGTGPWGLLGNVIAGLVGIFLMLRVLGWVVPGDISVEGVPIITAILGAIIVDLVLSYAVRRGGPRRTYRRRRAYR